MTAQPPMLWNALPWSNTQRSALFILLTRSSVSCLSLLAKLNKGGELFGHLRSSVKGGNYSGGGWIIQQGGGYLVCDVPEANCLPQGLEPPAKPPAKPPPEAATAGWGARGAGPHPRRAPLPPLLQGRARGVKLYGVPPPPPLSSTHVLRGIGRVGPAASRYTKGLILDQHVRHVPNRVGATARSVQGVANNQCT